MSHEGNETYNDSFWKPTQAQVNIGRADEISGFEQSFQSNNLAKKLLIVNEASAQTHPERAKSRRR